MKTPLQEIITKRNDGKKLSPLEFAIMCLFDDGYGFDVLDSAANELSRLTQRPADLAEISCACFGYIHGVLVVNPDCPVHSRR